jgi:acyl carrier protein
MRYFLVFIQGCGMFDKPSLTPRLYELACAAAPGLAGIEGDPANAELRDAGMSSIAAVRLMLEVEAAFDIAIPDRDLTPENFSTIAQIERLVQRLMTSAMA